MAAPLMYGHREDWDHDVLRFADSSAVLLWFRKLQRRLKDAVAAEEGNGWEAMFARFDTDGSGELDEAEFAQVQRA